MSGPSQEFPDLTTDAKNLPAPRLELRWKQTSPNTWRCNYLLVIALGQYDCRRTPVGKKRRKNHCARIGFTNRTSSASPFRFGKIDTPYRDGAHAKWDSPQLGNLPIYATYQGRAFKIEPDPQTTDEATR